MTDIKRRATGALCCSRFRMLGVSLLFAVCGSSRLLLWGQDGAVPSSEASALTADAKQTYLKLCSGCHGLDARGSQQAPGLSDNPNLRRRSVGSLHNLIRNGFPAAGMPPFDLPSRTLDSLAALIVSLNSSASEIAVPGDVAAGETFFHGKGQCASCHIVFGQGQAVGPDLSDVGRGLTLGQMREKLLNPEAEITPGYQLVTVHLLDGKTLRGFARNRTNFTIVLQDLEGGIYALSLDRVAKIDEEKQSLMPSLSASPDELQNLFAYMSRLTGIQPGVRAAAASPAKDGIEFSRILNPEPGNWLTYNGKLSGNRYSDLTQVNAATVSRLGMTWSFSIPLWSQLLSDTPYFRENMRYFGLETVPIVADGIMYITGPNQVFALDARTGSEVWHYARPRTPGLVSDAALGTNRGVAILGDKVFTVTDNAHLIALNRITGRPVWEMVIPDDRQHYGATLAPLVVKDMIIVGVSGGDWGIRGFLAAYRAENGERVWRHWTVPSNGEPGFDTWKGTAVTYGGGGTWLTGSYDPETDTLYWATGNPYPDSDDRERGGDNLYTDSVLALNPADGKLKWYYQFTPHDTHDWDSTEPNVLIDTKYQGEDRKLLLHADRNGFFYVFDRISGQILTSRSFIQRMTWASSIGPGGRPVRLPDTNETCPEAATNWSGTAYSPETRLYYVMALEKCDIKLSPTSTTALVPKEIPGKKYLRALSIDTGQITWEVPEIGPTDGKRLAGVLATAGGLVLYGDPSGDFVAVDARNGKTLWHFPLNATFKTSPMTFSVDGQQYIAIAVGSTIMCFGLTQ
jgi:PQQ-dependent dehydrogenase (methanol/ethanol family)